MTLRRCLILALLPLALLAAGAGKPGAAPRVLRIAAAADLEGALTELVSAYRTAHPDVDVKVSYGASGTLARQLAEKAPFDVFLSADAEYPRALQKKGLVAKDGVFEYAVGKLAVWVPNASGLDFAREGLKALAAPGVKQVSLANPRHAPYGRAAEAALKKAGLYEGLAPKLVLGENVAQAAQFARTGAVDAGLVAYAGTLTPVMAKSGRAWVVPQDLYPPLVQAGAVMGAAADLKAAQAFEELLLAAPGQAILARFGFSAPARPGPAAAAAGSPRKSGS